MDNNKKKILIIEDDDTLRLNIQDFLVEENFEVLEAENGIKGIELCIKRKPDLIICDIQMPEMDGYEVFNKLKENEFTSIIPFIYLTAKVDSKDLIKGINIGADDYITKPFEFDRLLAVINTKIKKFEAIEISNQKKYQSLIENSLTGVFIFQNNNFVYVNPKFKNIFGINSSENETQIKLENLFYNNDFKDVTEKFNDCLNFKIESFSIECNGISSNNKNLRIELYGGRSKYQGNYALLGNVLDVTDKFNLNREIRISEKNYRDLLSLVPVGIAKCDLQGNIIFVNSHLIKIFEYTKNNFFKKSFWEFIPEENERSLIIDYLQKSIEHKSPPVPYITDIQKESGEKIKVEIVWNYLYDDKNEVIGFINSIADVTERETNRSALIQSEARFRSLAEVASDWIWEIDENGLYNYVSDRVFEILGYTNTELIGRSPVDFIVDREKSKVEKFMQKIYNNKEPFKFFENTCVHKNGSEIIVETSGVPIFDDFGNFIGYRGVDTDVTRRKLAETKIKDINSRLTVLLKNLPNIILYESRSGMEFVSENVNSLLGISASTIQENPNFFVDHIVKDDYEKLNESINKWFNKKSKETLIVEYRMKKYDGSIIWVEDRMSITETEDGKPYITGILINITERKLAEDKILIFSWAIEQNPISIMITDSNGICEYINPKFSEISGYYPDEIIGKTHFDLITDNDNFVKYNKVMSVISSGERFEKDIFKKRKNGDGYWEHLTIVPIQNKSGFISHYLLLMEDITSRKHYENELKQAKERAEDANKLKATLFKNLSHEFRTPLNAILGFAELLQEDLIDIEQIKMCKDIYESGQRLFNTLNSILRLAQIESLDYNLNLNKINVAEIVKETFEIYHKEAINKGLDYKLIIKSPDSYAYADKNLLQLAVGYIIDNAIKYTNNGYVNVTVESFKDENKMLLLIRISDSGIGISDEEQKIIFKAFRQASEGYSRSYEGSGLGLTLAKRFVEMINGTIFLESKYNVGSTFSIALNLLNTE